MKEETPIRFKAIIEILGKPQEHVEETLRLMIKKIEDDKDIHVLNKDFADAKPSDNMWTTFCEIECVVNDFSRLFGFCIDYMPSSVEIIKPEQVSFNSQDLTNMVNDLQAKLHTIDMVAKKLRNENQFLKKNMNNMVQNSIRILLQVGIDTLDKLSKHTGIDGKELEKILQLMEKEDSLKKEGDRYILKR
jgi:hypothetical protein